MTLDLFETAAAILGITTLACWINARLLKLPLAAGLLVLGLAVSIGVAALDLAAPGLALGRTYGALVARIDYPALILKFLLAYLLFAGAMNVDLGALKRRGWSVALLAVFGTITCALLIGLGFRGLAGLAGLDLPLRWALAFGVLISPTDPIAVLAMTRRTDLQAELRAQLEGEALFNDGVAVVLFRVAAALAVGQAGAQAGIGALAAHALVEGLAGAALGFVAGGLAVLVVRVVDDWATETLITLSVATAVYALALHMNWSGPIAVVVAGLVTGSRWAESAMSHQALSHLRPFWRVVDEAMNAVLFFILGLKAWELRLEPAFLWLAIGAPLLVLAARWVMLAAPVAALRLLRVRIGFNLVHVLTWAGVRGGLSAAMALSLPDSPARQPILMGTLAVVVFSILVQSLTMERLALKTGYGRLRDTPLEH